MYLDFVCECGVQIQPTFGLSGKLAEETNKVRGIALLFVEPPEARKPTTRWRFYVFKDGEAMKGEVGAARGVYRQKQGSKIKGLAIG